MELREMQISLEYWGAAFCFIAAICLAVGKDEEKQSCSRLMFLQIINAIYLVADGITWLYDGELGEGALEVLYASNMLVYVMNFLTAIFTAAYVKARIVDGGGSKKQPWAIVVYLIGAAAIISVIISQFTDFYYSFDSNNIYHREDGYIYSQIFAIVMLIISISMMLVYRKYLSMITRVTIMIFSFLPILASLYQFFNYGISLIGLSTTVGLLFIFISYEIDHERRLEEKNKKELKVMIYKD